MAKAKRPASTPKPGQGGQSARPKPATGTIATKARPAGPGSTASATQSSRLEAIRARTGQQPPAKRPQNRRKIQQQPWYKGAGGLWSAVGVVFLVVVIIFVIAGHQASTTLTPISQTVYNQVTGISPQTFAAVGAGSSQIKQNPLQATTTGTPVYKDASGKPIVLYVGAEYCPYCAAERWSLIAALSRFGTFSGLKEMTSTDSDTPADVPTFSFEGAHYTSQYITFDAKEIQDRNGQNLDTLSSAENDIFNTYDSPPYVQSNSAGGIPFISFGNQYLTHSAGYTVQVLNGQTRDSIAAKLNDPKDPITIAIVGNANYITSAICSLTNNQPASVCGAAPIPDLMKQLPAHQAQPNPAA